MSYEGFTQFLCKRGHYWTADCYIADNSKSCPYCGNAAVWQNMVDETNGAFDEETGERIDGYVDLQIKSRGTCKHCGQDIETTYKIPKIRKSSNRK